MKRWMPVAAGFALIASVAAANAQNPPASDQPGQAAQTNSAPSGQSKSQKHAKMVRHPVTGRMVRHPLATRHPVAMRHRATTTGAGGRVGPIGGPQNDPSIHQSIQRDSRGTPKGPGSDYNK